ncbi:Polynucleotide 5'-hydroxyl-kinase grc3 [Aspergillus nanangensis]|uniref:Polynucleotide 5'-hydroxyl-kinase GRC3 n=1 Tax=Aspergillus nanangensis TaxID=2582783 RepID=A0AAD4CU29_ASPNN|nr:Polynucleotide 5'-hydroxyl-kinase grc3 [Aspergillus nanangensis]
MKRKAEKPQSAVSAIAARRARQQQAQVAPTPVRKTPADLIVEEPPSKKARRSSDEESPPRPAPEEDRTALRRSSRRKPDVLKAEESTANKPKTRSAKTVEHSDEIIPTQHSENQVTPNEELEEPDTHEAESNDESLVALDGDGDDYESTAETSTLLENFPLSKTRLNKSNVVYSDEETLCVRIKEKTGLVLVGHYDLWVKRGVISLMGAKLHPSPKLYRVYAPSTHSLPVIKCVSGVDGSAEIEIKSCHSGIYRLNDLSPLYHRIWNGKKTKADEVGLKSAQSRRTFSVLYTSADDPLKRPLRPLHLEKQWSSAIKSLSQKGGRLKALICGPKGSGKSTFSRYLLNHLLSPAPQTETNYYNTDGVAFLDLDPGQPEFSPMGQVYLAHLRSPVFGPPFSHPSLEGSQDGSIVRAHHIGATSPKDDPDHYVLAATDLMDRYRALLASYPQCPLIINYPGWIFGLGLEVAIWLVRSLGLSDVVYMSEKGPMEVVEPLGQAAHAAMVPLMTLPSQPTDFTSRSSAQMRSMQIQSYFHMCRPSEISTPLWFDKPMSRVRPFHVAYAGPKQGIRGIMVLGSHINPDLLHEMLDGSIVGVVAIESPDAILGHSNALSNGGVMAKPPSNHEDGSQPDSDTNMENTAPEEAAAPSIDSSVTHTPNEDLPYLFAGAGSCNPLNPKASHSLGLALVRSIDVSSKQLELVTPIATSKIRDALQQGYGIVLVRGPLDSPNWAVSEDYYAARAAEKRHRRSIESSRASNGTSRPDEMSTTDDHARLSTILKDRIRRSSNVPWMTVIEDNSRRQREAAQRERSLWKLRKRAYTGSDSEGGW